MSRKLESAYRKKLDRAVQSRFGESSNEVRIKPRLFLIRDSPGYQIGIHKDIFSKFITTQIYLPRDEKRAHLGTRFYRKLPSRKFEQAKRMEYLPNTGYAFGVNNNSWHGVDVLQPGDGVRDSIMLTYYVQEDQPKDS